MDIHTVDSDEFSAEDVVKAHMEDLAIQDRYNVKQLKYWVNEQAKTIFCLTEGPNKEACNQVHLQSHGNTACNIIEVSDNEYNLFMGQGTNVDDLAQTKSGELDPGYRTIILINVISFEQNNIDYLNKIKQFILEHNGIIVREPNHQIMITFMYATDALSFASAIRELLLSASETLEYNLAIVSGKPVDENGSSFFEETKAKINTICGLGLNKKMYLDQETIVLSEKEMQLNKALQSNFIILKKDDFLFATKIYNIIREQFKKSDFKSEDLITEIGLSKSQANRKIKAITGFAPNQLIQESKLQSALIQMANGRKTIAETAYESGFNSPAYFTRVFKKRFNISPSDYNKMFL